MRQTTVLFPKKAHLYKLSYRYVLSWKAESNVISKRGSAHSYLRDHWGQLAGGHQCQLRSTLEIESDGGEADISVNTNDRPRPNKSENNVSNFLVDGREWLINIVYITLNYSNLIFT